MSIDTSKIIHGVVGGGRYTVTSPIVKEDYGLYLLIEGLELPSTYEVDFSNSEHNGTSVTMIGNSDGVLIPSQFISSGKDVFAFLYHVGEDYGRTVYKFRIPNKVRPDRTDDEPTPEEQSTIGQCISALNTAVAQTAQDVIDADQSAQSAQEYAEQAETARDTAQTYANNAQTSANNASASASQASASATASAQSASQAEQIKTDVQGMVSDAQGYASASAQSASASANSASDAQGYAQGASASAQSASGYASNAQTSANTASNKASEASTSASTASAKATESAQSASQALTYKTDAESAKTASQTAQGLAESARDSAQGYAEDAQGYAEDAQASAEGISASASQIAQNTADILKTFPTDTASGAVASFSDGADDLPLKSLVVDINPVQDLSHGDPSPENICPISGWTACKVWRAGINIWDEQTKAGTFDISTGAHNPNRLDIICTNTPIKVTPSTSYYLAFPSGVTAGNVYFYDSNMSFLSMTYNKANKVVTTPSGCGYVNISFGAMYGSTYNNNISFNYPSTDHDYHPYTGRSITINLGQTVYGGKLDVLSGVLTVDMAMVDLGSLRWTLAGTSRFYAALTPMAKVATTIAERTQGMICSCYPFSINTGYADTMNDKSMLRGGNTTAQIMIKDTAYTDATSFKPAMSGVQLVYELAEPIEIQLTPHEVNSLLGQNNIFADTGDTACEYRADTKLYISRLTEPDADMTADANITSGQYFMVGNSLYKATSNIANGAQIVVGTNCIRKSLSEALNEINA